MYAYTCIPKTSCVREGCERHIIYPNPQNALASSPPADCPRPTMPADILRRASPPHCQLAPPALSSATRPPGPSSSNQTTPSNCNGLAELWDHFAASREGFVSLFVCGPKKVPSPPLQTDFHGSSAAARPGAAWHPWSRSRQPLGELVLCSRLIGWEWH